MEKNYHSHSDPQLPEIFPVTLGKIREHTVLGVVKGPLAAERPVPAAGSFKTKQAQRRQLRLITDLDTLIGDINAMFTEGALHFFQIGLTVIAEEAANIFGSFPQHHSQHSLTALQVSRLVDIIYLQSHHLIFDLLANVVGKGFIYFRVFQLNAQGLHIRIGKAVRGASRRTDLTC